MVAEANVSAVSAHLVMVRVPDADTHHERARRHGAKILIPPTDHPFGERQHSPGTSQVIDGGSRNPSPT